MAEYTLHCFAQSGNAYKAALMLTLCGADWEPRFVDFFNGETRSAAYRENINEMGEVPVLEHAGMKLSQSGAILDYLAEHLGRFGAANDAERREIWRWILFDNHKLTGYLATYRFMLEFMKTGDTEVTAFLAGRAKSSLGILNRHLDAQAFVIGDQPTIADLSICGYLYFQDEIPLPWAEFSNVNRWLDRLKGLEGWQHPYQLMPGHPLPRG